MSIEYEIYITRQKRHNSLIYNLRVVSEVLLHSLRSYNGILYEFRNDEYLQQHFEKHGAEFPYATAEEYLAGANRVVQSPDALHKTEAEDGDDVYYLEAGNEFVIVSKDGYLRTYFKPSAGIDYYNRQ